MRRNRKKVNKELKSYRQRMFLSSASYSRDIILEKVLAKYAHGKLIDLGCGDMPFKELIQSKTIQYDTLDIDKTNSEIKFIADIQDMNMIDQSSYDCALALSVLEHVQNPFLAISEISRILKKSGILILSAPCIMHIHDSPKDFFRYTNYGILSLLNSASLNMIEIEPTGGFFSYVGHLISSILICLFWHIPIMKRFVYFINKYVIVKSFYLLDKVFDKEKVFAIGYVCVAKK